MFYGIYSNASAMGLAAKQHEVVANNLANANVPGFRRSVLLVTANPIARGEFQGDLEEAWKNRQVASTRVDQTQGAIVRTGRQLDMAINGDGFFVIETPQGIRYTRAGAFQVNEQGTLVTPDGHSVVGEGAITFNPEVSMGDVTVDSAGVIRAAGTEIGKLKLVSFAEPELLEQTGPTRFADPAGITSSDATGTVMQGALESSNTSTMHEMVAMIAGMRHYEAAQQALRSISEVIRQYTTQN
jgi:flagellar basal-body rod protein FlgF